MGQHSLFASRDKLSAREQALVNYVAFAAFRNEEGIRRVRETAPEAGLPPEVMEQVGQAVEAARAVDLQSMGLDAALAQSPNSACCHG